MTIGFNSSGIPNILDAQVILGTPCIKPGFVGLFDGSCDRATDYHPGEFISFTIVTFSHRFLFAVCTGYYLSNSISSLLSSGVEAPVIWVPGRYSLILGGQMSPLAQMDET